MKSKGLKFEWTRNLVAMFVEIIMIQLIVLNVKVTSLLYFIILPQSLVACLMFVSKSVTDINGVLQIRNLMAVLLIRKAEFDATFSGVCNLGCLLLTFCVWF